MKKTLWIVISLIAALSLAGCCCCCTSNERTSRVVRDINAGPVQRVESNLESKGAERVELTLVFGGGELMLRGDDDIALMAGEFVYNVDELEPLIEYTVQDGLGILSMRHQGDQIRLERQREEIRNEWDVRLTRNIPFDLIVDVGASDGELTLGGLRITGLDLNAGAADMKVSFEELNPAELELMTVRSGAARLEFISLGNANLRELTFDGGVGTYEFDLSGDWQRSAAVKIKSGVSHIVLRIPSDIGVRICPGDLKSGSYDGLSQQGECYVNEMYENANLKLDIDLDVGLSSVEVK